MINFITVKRKSTGEYLYTNEPCKKISIYDGFIIFTTNSGRMEQLQTDFYYWIIGNQVIGFVG